MTEISIIGAGRFGKTLVRLLHNCRVAVYDSDPAQLADLPPHATPTTDLTEIFKNKVIFYAVPISMFADIVSSHQQYFDGHLIIDVLSVKLHPEKVLKSLDNNKFTYLLTHPMFGPDSSKADFTGLPIVVDRGSSTQTQYDEIMDIFTTQGLRIIEMSADKHDRSVAYSQGVTHLLGRTLDRLGMVETEIDTSGAKKLNEIKIQTTNDTWQLFHDLQTYNPYCAQMRQDLQQALKTTIHRLEE